MDFGRHDGANGIQDIQCKKAKGIRNCTKVIEGTDTGSVKITCKKKRLQLIH